ncbi:MAG: hypothetical protein ACPHUF_01390 [Gammaproteobacteria bacterium]
MPKDGFRDENDPGDTRISTGSDRVNVAVFSAGLVLVVVGFVIALSVMYGA